MGLRSAVYGLYANRVLHTLPAEQLPRHVGVILDGNRRWADYHGSSSDAGHRAGAARVAEGIDCCSIFE